MRRTGVWWVGVACVALTLGANPAPAQSTRPAATTAPAAVADVYKNVPLPSGRGAAATQATITASTAASSDPLDTKRVAIALGVVLLAIYAALRAWRKLGMPGSAAKGGQTLQVVSRLALSPRQQILLIRVGRRFVLVANNGTQMNPLCEIANPEEAAALLGQTVTESRESASATFNEVLDGAQQQFNVDAPHKPSAPPDDDETPEDATLAATREELGAMMDKVRSLTKHFQQQHQRT
jgi:flagellar biogenesis protein FliO